MKNLIRILLIGILFISGCNTVNPPNNSSMPNETQQVYKKISSEEANEIISSTKDYILLDVRTDEEFMQNHIEGALLIPDYEISNRASTDLPDKDALILIYCRSGRRSSNVAKLLSNMGYTNIYDFGGINDWKYDTVMSK